MKDEKASKIHHLLALTGKKNRKKIVFPKIMFFFFPLNFPVFKHISDFDLSRLLEIKSQVECHFLVEVIRRLGIIYLNYFKWT